MDSPSPDQPETRLTTTSATSLFPIFPVSSSDAVPSLPPSSSSDNPEWLSNSSFSFDVSKIPSTTPLAVSEDEPEPIESPKHQYKQPRKYDLVQSGSDSGSDEERKLWRKERRKKRRKRERGEDPNLRKSGVRAWTGSDKKPVKDYYFDAKGDRDNLAFGSLYKMDIARYKLQNHTDSSKLNFKNLSNFKPSSNSNLYEDSDLDAIDTKSKSGGRYFSIKYSDLYRDKNFKHLKIAPKDNTPLISSEEYIPLDEKDSDSSEEIEESWEDEIIKKTREFNKNSREFPHDEKVWLAFAEFQDKIAKSQRKKAARVQIIEKKISILEKAIELNPGNESLIICLLNSHKERDGFDAVLAKWENILTEYSDSVRLWKEYLSFCQGDFSRFKVSEIRKNYAYAVKALFTACYKLSRQDSDSQLVQLELGLVDIFTKLCRFEWQTGHRELASGLFQAQIEYSLFSPILNLTPSNKKRLFEYFWNSGGARVGEDESLGWSTWLTKDEENLQRNIPSQEREEEVEGGGWTGWVDFDRESKAVEGVKDGNDENAPEGDDKNNSEDDVEALLRKLGIDVDSESNSEVNDAKIWYKWSQEELIRDNKQWMPVRENNLGDEQLSRMILFDDVADYLFSLNSEEARFSLICQFINFFGGNITQWTCTNNATWLDQILSLESLPNQILQEIKLANETRSSDDNYLESILDTSSEILTDTNMMKFVKNAILLFLEIFPRNHILQETLISVQDCLSNNSSRSLAKTLLKKDRQDILLCGVYAKNEAANGNIDMARKIFDMALLSTESAPKDLKDKSPLLFLWYAESETDSHVDRADSCVDRALHILSCQVSSSSPASAKYTLFGSPLTSLQVLRARQGFRERIKGLRAGFNRGFVTEADVAVVESACLFEVLTSGFGPGLEVLEQAFNSVLPERRSNSLELERLWVYYIELIQKNSKKITLSKIWKQISQGLQIYPFNPKSFSSILNLSGLYSVSNKVRLILDKYIQRNPSLILYIFAISFEWGRNGSQNRIHALFERALLNYKLQKSVLLWRLYIDYEINIISNFSSARRVFFRAIHACPWSKKLWLDGFQKLSSILTLKELSDLQEVMRDKELNIRTDIYEILLQDEMES